MGERLLDLRELHRHIVTSGAAESTSLIVRRWLVNQIRFILVEGNPEAWAFATTLCEKLLANWPETVEPDLRMRLRSHLNNLHRSLDDRYDSLSFDDELVNDLRAAHGHDHPRALRAARGKAHALRVNGRFTEALAEEHATVRMMRRVLGPNHPDTLMANNNLALSMFLAGDTAGALDLQLTNRDLRLQVLGEHSLDVWWSTCSVGIYLRELGDYQAALDELEEAFTRIVTLGPASPRHRMRVDWHKAITLRRDGNVSAALDKNANTWLEYGRVFGQDHTDTRACKLSLAADNHALGEFGTAAKLARECHQAYLRRLGESHLFTYMSQLDLAIFLEALGRDATRARQHVAEACRGLVTRLDSRVHPWALAARLAEAVVIGRTEDMYEGRNVLEQVRDDCADFLGAKHPTTLCAELNLKSNLDEWQSVVLDVPEM